jgi:hypothetical protein
MKTVPRYLATMEHNSTNPINRGLIQIRDDGFVIGADGDETPVEDFGMYILQKTPFPPTASEALFDQFLALLAEGEK